MKSANIVYAIIFLLIGATIGYFLKFVSSNEKAKDVEEQQEVVDVLDEKSDLIRMTSPLPGEMITSPLTISGEARGYWFFEATAPVVLTDWDGLIIAEGYVTTQGDWMTEEFVPFKGTLNFDRPLYGETGTLIMKKANASGLPEHDDALEYTIKFQLATVEQVVRDQDVFNRYTDGELPFSFEYRIEPDGYTMQQLEMNDFYDNQKRGITILRVKDAEELEDSDPREGPPTIGIQVFENAGGKKLVDWLFDNNVFTNFTNQETDEVRFNNTDGIVYLWNGLYQASTVAVAYEEHIYLFTGAYSDSDDTYQQDFEEFLQYIRFIK